MGRLGLSPASRRSPPRATAVALHLSRAEDEDDLDELYRLYAQESREAPNVFAPVRPVAGVQGRGRVASPPGAPARHASGDAATPSPTPLSSPFLFAFPQPPGPAASASAQPLTGARIERHCLRPLLVQFLALMEGATAWVTGVAWTDAIVAFTSLGQYPTAAVTLQDVGVGSLLTAIAIGSLAFAGRQRASGGGGPHAMAGHALSGAISEEAKGSREAVELFFLTNALTFVVGWSWVVVARDLSTLVAAALITSFDAPTFLFRSLLAALAALAMGPALAFCCL